MLVAGQLKLINGLCFDHKEVVLNYQINTIEGIGPEHSNKLNQAGINTVEDLLNKGTDPSYRHKLAAESGCTESTILKWVGMADLFRITGVSSQYSELLNACAVNSVGDLANRSAHSLHKKMLRTNKDKNICKAVPSIEAVEKFINQAQKLPRIKFI